MTTILPDETPTRLAEAVADLTSGLKKLARIYADEPHPRLLQALVQVNNAIEGIAPSGRAEGR